MMSDDFIIGGPGELDLSLLGKVTNELPIQDAKKHVKFDGLSDSALVELLRYADALKEQEQFGGLNNWFKPGTKYGIERLPKHKAFFDASRDYTQIYFSAANRVGKTQAASYAGACHLTGLYPDWWEGRVYKKPNHAWAVGLTNTQTRDVIQDKYLGPLGSFGTGMIPKELIVGTTTKSGSGGALDKIQVRHVPTGGVSTLAFRSVEQGWENLQGVTLDWAHCDELPRIEVYSEIFIRVMTTKGFIMVTATPKKGMTPLVFSFYSQADFLPETEELPAVLKIAREDFKKELEAAKKAGEKLPTIKARKAVVVAGWADAPWLDEEMKAEIDSATPEHMKQAVKTGLPGSAGGSIYPVPLEDITVADFPIPDHYKLVNGFDVGWNNSAAAFLALDPDTDTLYMYGEYKRGKAEPIIHAEALKTKSKWVDAPIAIDPASEGRSQVDGKQLYNLYRKHGLKLHKADNAIEAGIHAVWERLSVGKLKVFKSCKEFQREYITYQRDEKDRIVKENDHILDALRYAVMSLNMAKAPYRAGGQFGNIRGNTSGKRYF